jgi:hypothetical protein
VVDSVLEYLDESQRNSVPGFTEQVGDRLIDVLRCA